MDLIESRREQIFPVLTSAQIAIAARFAAAPPRRAAAGETLFAAGEPGAPAFLVTEGAIQVGQRDAFGRSAAITTHGVGEFTGEINQLAGRPSLAEGRAGPAGCTALPFDAPHLRALLIGSAEIGEILMRAFILRRTALLAQGGSGSVLLGHGEDPALLGIAEFLHRNGYPAQLLDPDADADARALVDRLGLHAEELPIVLCPDGSLLRRPTQTELASRLGMVPVLDPERVFDVAVVGAGPAGLATAVYAASEGLSVLVLDSRAFGGQAGASARIENYLGFPTGISGHALMARAATQAQKFGAELAIPLQVERLECSPHPGCQPVRLHLSNGQSARARGVVIASGARYRKPAIAGLDRFEGAGVSYWASPVEAKLCAGETVALVGAGNSAGQAIAFLAPRVKKLLLIVRGDGLAASMSRYLIDRIAALPNVEMHTRTEVTALAGDAQGHLARATFENRDSGSVWHSDLRHLFLFIGADPNTAWLEGCGIEVDAHGFVCTGATGHALETSVRGVFAIGDVRAGSTKRVAAAVGEGAAVVAALHASLG